MSRFELIDVLIFIFISMYTYTHDPYLMKQYFIDHILCLYIIYDFLQELLHGHWSVYFWEPHATPVFPIYINHTEYYIIQNIIHILIMQNIIYALTFIRGCLNAPPCNHNRCYPL